jgi:DNA-binding CsgD family transcriptional regulator
MVRECLPAGVQTPLGPMGYFWTVALQRLAVELACDTGDLPTARAWLMAHDRWLAWSGSMLGRAKGQLLWATFQRVGGDASRAHRHAQQALVAASDPRQPLILLAAHRLLGELATGGKRSIEATAHLDAALALADACAAPYERALTLVACAELHAATGHRDAVLPLLDEVRSIATPLHAMPLLARADVLAVRLTAAKATAPAYPVGLSAREVEVLRLVAAGRTNTEIATALSISKHTVIHHVTHILAKTQSDNRVAAAAFALRHDLI